MANFSGPEKADKSNQNYKQKCFYLLSLIKIYDKKVYQKLNQEFNEIDVNESFDFYTKLLSKYKELKDAKTK